MVDIIRHPTTAPAPAPAPVPPAPAPAPAPNAEEIREREIHAVANNGRFNLMRPGNQGRYTRSRYFRSHDEWDSIFRHLVGIPHILHDTADFIYYTQYSQGYEMLEIYEFPKLVLIPLPPTSPHFHRVVLHVECINAETDRPMGQYIPLLISYHENHPIAQAMTQLFYVDDAPQYQSNEALVMLTYYQPQPIQNGNHHRNHDHPALHQIHIHRMCSYLTQPGNDFDAFDHMEIALSTFILPDNALVARANREVVIPDYDIDPEMAREGNERWLDIVYPDRFATEQQRREAYDAYAAEQINIHRRMRQVAANEYIQELLEGGRGQENDDVFPEQI
jgi:hypothetical protein